jgi:ubiquinone/menaquinone biosynthesis C-methylase UbiE
VLNKKSFFNKPLFFSKTFFPQPTENKMKHVGDVASARAHFLTNRPSNLTFLLEKRYSWMNDFIDKASHGIEVGCGTGLSKEFIKHRAFKLTDIANYDWVDCYVDALQMPFKDSSLDFIISSNMIHHLARPAIFFNECSRVLKKDGILIIQEINASLMMRTILRLMRHEGYSYNIDVFNPNINCNDPHDAWSANCALPNLLFDDKEKFERFFPFKIIHQKYTEFFICLFSGGVIAKTKTINLPHYVLKLVDRFDNLLIILGKKVFPLQRQLVLKNCKN